MTFLLAGVLLGGAPAANAQGPRQALSPDWRPDTAPASTGRLVLGGLIGTGAAVGAGALVYQLAGSGTVCGDDPCGLVAGLLMAIVVEPIVVPLGVHLANHGRGNFVATLLASTAAAGAIMLAGHELGLGSELLIAIPLGQIAGSVLAERHITHD